LRKPDLSASTVKSFILFFFAVLCVKTFAIHCGYSQQTFRRNFYCRVTQRRRKELQRNTSTSGILSIRKRQSCKIVVVKKTIKAGKVQRTGILQISVVNISVRCTFCLGWILFTTTINGALHLEMLTSF